MITCQERSERYKHEPLWLRSGIIVWWRLLISVLGATVKVCFVETDEMLWMFSLVLFSLAKVLQIATLAKRWTLRVCRQRSCSLTFRLDGMLIDNGFGQSGIWMFQDNSSAQQVKQLPSLWFVVCLIKSDQSNGSKVFSFPFGAHTCTAADIYCQARGDLWCFLVCVVFVDTVFSLPCSQSVGQSGLSHYNTAGHQSKVSVQLVFWVNSSSREVPWKWQPSSTDATPCGRCCILLSLRLNGFSSIMFGRIRAMQLKPDSIWSRMWL